MLLPATPASRAVPLGSLLVLAGGCFRENLLQGGAADSPRLTAQLFVRPGSEAPALYSTPSIAVCCGGGGSPHSKLLNTTECRGTSRPFVPAPGTTDALGRHPHSPIEAAGGYRTQAHLSFPPPWLSQQTIPHCKGKVCVCVSVFA